MWVMASNVNTLSIDVNGLWMAIQNECYVLLNDVAAKIIEGFQLYIVSDGAGRIKWRENAAKEFKILSEKMSDDMMEMTLGVQKRGRAFIMLKLWWRCLVTIMEAC